MKHPVALNPFAREFVPTKQVYNEDGSLGKAEAAPVTNSNESE